MQGESVWLTNALAYYANVLCITVKRFIAQALVVVMRDRRLQTSIASFVSILLLFSEKWFILCYGGKMVYSVLRRHDTKLNDTQHNGTYYSDTQLS